MLRFFIFFFLFSFIFTTHSQAFYIGSEADWGVYSPDQNFNLLTQNTLQDIGASDTRVFLLWNWVSSACNGQSAAIKSSPLDINQGGCYHWDKVDSAILRAHKDGQQVILSQRMAPNWLFPGKIEGYVGATDEEFTYFRQEFAYFMRAATLRYNGRTYNLQGQLLPAVKAWTIWNEPNGASLFWSEGEMSDQDWRKNRRSSSFGIKRACHYAQLFNDIQPIIKQNIGIRSEVAFGAIAPRTEGLWFIQQAHSCLKKLPDAIAVNAYPSVKYPPTERGTIKPYTKSYLPHLLSLNNLEDLHLMMKKLTKYQGKRIWVTETGLEAYPAEPAGVSTAKQSAWMAASMEKAQRLGVKFFSWYALIDSDDLGDWQSGVLKADHKTRQPSYAMFQAPITIRYDRAQSRRNGQSTFHIWAFNQQGSPDILVSTHCRPFDLKSRYRFLRIKATIKQARITRATIRTNKSFCIAQASKRGIARASVIQIMQTPKRADIYLVYPRSVSNAWTDPKNSVLRGHTSSYRKR